MVTVIIMNPENFNGIMIQIKEGVIMRVHDLSDEELISCFNECKAKYFDTLPWSAEEKLAEDRMEWVRREMAERFIKVVQDRKRV